MTNDITTRDETDPVEALRLSLDAHHAPRLLPDGVRRVRPFRRRAEGIPPPRRRRPPRRRGRDPRRRPAVPALVESTHSCGLRDGLCEALRSILEVEELDETWTRAWERDRAAALVGGAVDSGEVMPMRCATYARKSTDERSAPAEARSVERQAEACAERAKANGHAVAEAFSDDGVSGYLFAGRPGFTAMMRSAEAGGVDAVLIWDLDRFGRNSRRTMEALHKLDDAGVEVIDVASGRPVELDGFGEATTYLRTLVAQEFRAGIRKNVRRSSGGRPKRATPRARPPSGTTRSARASRSGSW